MLLLSHRHGTDQAGSQRQPEVTTRRQAQRSADSNATPITTGTVLLQLVTDPAAGRKILITGIQVTDPDTPAKYKAVIAGALGYLILPLDVLPVH